MKIFNIIFFTIIIVCTILNTDLTPWRISKGAELDELRSKAAQLDATQGELNAKQGELNAKQGVLNAKLVELKELNAKLAELSKQPAPSPTPSGSWMYDSNSRHSALDQRK
jgi:hypothetical protein